MIRAGVWRLQRGRMLRGTAALILLATLIVVTTWLLSSRRQQEIDVRRISCVDSLPWYYLASTHHDRLYTPSESFLAANPAYNQGSRISVLQVCSGARHWSLLDEVVSNHRSYAGHHGYEYRLQTEGHDGVWDKIIYLHEKIKSQLEQPASDRFEWLFMTDTDTYIPNLDIPISALLPPRHLRNPPFLLISKDHNGLNAGNFLIAVNNEALDFLGDVLSHRSDANSQRFAEQSVMASMIQSRNLENLGRASFLPQNVLNSYAGAFAFDEALPVFNLHFPSVGLKRRSMLPMMSRLRRGELAMSSDTAAASRKQVKEIMSKHWHSHASDVDR